MANTLPFNSIDHDPSALGARDFWDVNASTMREMM